MYFVLTYQELLRRKLGLYEHVTYINPGQLVNDFKVEVAIQESRAISTLEVPPLRSDLLSEAKSSNTGNTSKLKQIHKYNGQWINRVLCPSQQPLTLSKAVSSRVFEESGMPRLSYKIPNIRQAH